MAMGQRVAVHRGTFGAGGWLWYLGGICLLSGVLGLIKAGGDSQKLLTAVIALGVAPLLLIVPVLRWQQTVEVFEQGFVWKRLYGSVQVLRADVRNVTLITHHSRRGTYVEVKVELASGKSHSIVGVEQPEQLANLLRAAAPSAQQFSAHAGAGAPGIPQQTWGPGGWKPPGT